MYACLCMLRYFSLIDSLQPYELQPARLLCPCNFSGKNTRMGCHVLQGIFLTQGSNSHHLHLLHWQMSSKNLPLVPPGKSPIKRKYINTVSTLSRVEGSVDYTSFTTIHLTTRSMLSPTFALCKYFLKASSHLLYLLTPKYELSIELLFFSLIC